MSKRKLLLADDSVTIQKVVNLTFADEGIEVITAGDGNTAMERFSEYAPDLVLADVNMPGLNGYEICEIIRKNEETKNTPVILLVGSFEPFDAAEAQRVGANDFLTKPFQSIRQLVVKVTDLMGANGNSDEFPQADEAIALETQSAEPEDDDIESLYKESFADTVELPNPSNGPDRFDAVGMDDEIIETSFADSSVEEEPFPSLEEPALQLQETVPQEEMFQSLDGPGFEGEQPEPATSHETAFGETATDFISQFEEQPADDFEEEAQDETFFDAISDADRTGYPEGPKQAEPTPWNSIAGPVQGAETAEPVESSETERMRFEFDDLNLLELPNGGIKRMASPPVDEITSTPETREQTGEISPGVIDLIAAKVADRISEQVIWALEGRIPEIVDAAVNRKIHEESNR